MPYSSYLTMNAENIIKFLGGLDELSLCCNFESSGKISMVQIDSCNYGLFVYSVQSHRISFLKLNVRESVLDYRRNFFPNVSETNVFEMHLLVNLQFLHFYYFID